MEFFLKERRFCDIFLWIFNNLIFISVIRNWKIELKMDYDKVEMLDVLIFLKWKLSWCYYDNVKSVFNIVIVDFFLE